MHSALRVKLRDPADRRISESIDNKVFTLLCSLVFDGAGRLISGATGFGDSPPEYTGKQEWPELVGENAALAKAQLVTETHLQVGDAQTCLLPELYHLRKNFLNAPNHSDEQPKQSLSPCR